MRIGGQKVLISVLRRVQTGRTDAGEPIWVWQEWRPEIWAESTVKRGKEQWDPTTKKRYSEVIWQFRTRYEEVIGISEVMEVGHEGNRYKIKSILPDDQNRRDVIIECTLEDGFLEQKALLPGIEDTISLGVVGIVYDAFTVSATGGAVPYTFTSTSLPPGLSIDDETGEVAGTPTVAGYYSITFTVTDADGEVETLPPITIEIEDP